MRLLTGDAQECEQQHQNSQMEQQVAQTPLEQQYYQELHDIIEYRQAQQAQSEAMRDIWETNAKFAEAVDDFAAEHPNFSKYSGKFLEWSGYAIQAMVLYAAAQTGPAAFVTTGLTMSAQEKLFAATIEHSMGPLVENAASHGRTEEESLRTGALGLFKFAKKSAPALMSKCASMKAGLRQGVHEVFTRTQTNRANFEQQNSQRLYDALNKSPYNARIMEQLLQSQYSDANISSRTMPKANAKNVKSAGKGRDFVIGTDEVTGQPIIKHIPFNERGMPIFDDVSACDVILPKNITNIKNRDLHFKNATTALKNLIQSGRVDKSLFTKKQLDSIFAESIRIPGFTWHHHENIGRMQLVPRDIHRAIGHFGRFDLWYK